MIKKIARLKQPVRSFFVVETMAFKQVLYLVIAGKACQVRLSKLPYILDVFSDTLIISAYLNRSLVFVSDKAKLVARRRHSLLSCINDVFNGTLIASDSVHCKSVFTAKTDFIGL